MGDFVTDQHIVQTVGHRFPYWKRQNSILEVEGCSLGFGIMHNREILGCEQSCEDCLGCLCVAHTSIIPQPAPKATHLVTL